MQPTRSRLGLIASLLTIGPATATAEEGNAVEANEAASAARLAPVVVTGSRIEADSFDLPYSIDAIDMREAGRNHPGVNVSEVMGTIPGVVVQNRQNYAQDLQISIRGFGARSAFGVRGVKLITDGIPATNPDGQGQAATFNLDVADRIEVLRGPFSTIYGNHSGGVIQLFSRDGEGPPSVTGGVAAGSWGTSRFRLGAEGEQGDVNYLLDASRFDTDGYRDHSAARRDQGFAKLNWNPRADQRFTLVANTLNQPFTKDPQGLDWTEYRRDPRSAASSAREFNTRKRIGHQQAGLTYQQQFGADSLELRAYAGSRRVVQFLSIPKAAQEGPENEDHAGGVVDFDREFHGLGARWNMVRELDTGQLTVTTGLDFDRSVDDRQGYENFVGSKLGVRGALRRDETNTISSTDPYVQTVWEQGRWRWTAGLRHSTVSFRVDDDFLANGDNSGSVTYREATPALGVLYEVNPLMNVYLSAGRGFETPTLNELSYSDDGGFNFDLEPARSRQLEAGIKAYVGENTRLNAAVFDIQTRNEIVVADSSGGRTSFTNAARTRRQGLELTMDSELSRNLTARGALTWINARYARDFENDETRIPAGNRLPGVPEVSAYGELTWTPRPDLETAVEAQYRSRVQVHDLNEDRAAPAHTLVNLRLSAEQDYGPWTFNQLLRVDNIFDREHVSSVIVGQGQGRYYEPGPTRSWYAGVSARYAF